MHVESHTATCREADNTSAKERERDRERREESESERERERERERSAREQERERVRKEETRGVTYKSLQICGWALSHFFEVHGPCGLKLKYQSE